MKIFKSTLIAVCVFTATVHAQNVGINATGAAPNNSTILDLNTGNNYASPNGKGLLIPNVSLTGTGDATTIASPATSLLVYNTATAGSGTTAIIPGYYYWDGTKWVRFQNTSSTAQDWNLLGNAGTTPGTNFIGTTDANDLVFKTNNTETMRVTSSGNVGIGTTSPAAKLEVNNGSTAGAIKIVDGTQGFGNVLTSDANGKASWKDFTNTTYDLSSSFSGPIPNSTSVVGNSIVLEKGVYYVQPYNLLTGITYSTGYFAKINVKAISGSIIGDYVIRDFISLSSSVDEYYTMPGFILKVQSSTATVAIQLLHGNGGTFSLSSINQTLSASFKKIN